MKIAKSVICLIAIVLTAPFAAAAQQVAPPVVPAAAAAPAAAGASAPSGEEYVLGPEDTIEIGILGQADRTRARIYTDGTIQMNLLGRVQVAGKTARELGDQLSKALKTGGFYEEPVVSVEIVGYSSRYVTVLGAVGQPGLIPINRQYHLSEILARVGGVRTDAADYIVVRSETGPEKRYSVNKLASGDATEDPFVTPGDKIFAPTAELFYISGQVKTPGSFPVSSDLTVAQAIARAGGLTDSGSAKKVKVTRGAKSEKLKPESKVLAGDVLVIGERLF